MIFEDVLAQLNHTDPKKRIEALHILAMVEETRAINAILVIYQQDPDPQVRKVAKWAGSSIWRAKEAGHTTEAALAAHFQRAVRPSQTGEDDRIMRQMTPLEGKKTDKIAAEYDEMQMLLAQSEALYRERTPQTDTQVMATLLPEVSEADDLDLLDAGLIDFF